MKRIIFIAISTAFSITTLFSQNKLDNNTLSIRRQRLSHNAYIMIDGKEQKIKNLPQNILDTLLYDRNNYNRKAYILIPKEKENDNKYKFEHKMIESGWIAGTNDECRIAQVPANHDDGYFYNPNDYDTYCTYRDGRAVMVVRAWSVQSILKKFKTSDIYGKWKDDRGFIFEFKKDGTVHITHKNSKTVTIDRPSGSNWGGDPKIKKQTVTTNMNLDVTDHYAAGNGFISICGPSHIHKLSFTCPNGQKPESWAKTLLTNSYMYGTKTSVEFQPNLGNLILARVVDMTDDEIVICSLLENPRGNNLYNLKRIK